MKEQLKRVISELREQFPEVLEQVSGLLENTAFRRHVAAIDVPARLSKKALEHRHRFFGSDLEATDTIITAWTGAIRANYTC